MERCGIVVHDTECGDLWARRLEGSGLDLLGIHPAGGSDAHLSLVSCLETVRTPAFRAETGVPIGEAILNERLARAKDLLRTTSLSCERIAAACGIYDANHLGHLFRRKFGASPSTFRTGR